MRGSVDFALPVTLQTGLVSGRALGSVVEHRLHTAGVSGSNPLAPTIFEPLRANNLLECLRPTISPTAAWSTVRTNATVPRASRVVLSRQITRSGSRARRGD